MDPSRLQISIDQVLGLGLLGLLLYALAELAYRHFVRKTADLREVRMATLGVLSIGGAGALVTVLVGPLTSVLVAVWAAPRALFQLELTWMAFAYGLVVYELFYWLQHWLAHKVRLLWCLHSPHHAPRSIHLFVGFNHSFLESVFYMPIVLGLFPALLGVPPVVIAAIAAVDVIWGNLLHVSDDVVPGRYGVLERFLQTPSYHRVHHARNVRYMDTNYNSITLLWDWLLGTLQPLDDAEPVRFGITREVDTGSFRDAHLGELRLLWRDVREAAGWRDRLAYLLMPPGWSPTGRENTVSSMKQRLAEPG